jgi:pimeloyl-ACP methyl ester carboxylesterase
VPNLTAGNIELFYRDDGEGQPVLFIQGLGVDHRAWAGVARPLSKRFRCISFDNRDVGRSPTVDAPYSVLDMAGDALGLLDELGIARADIVGTSMGGVMAQEIAIRHPERVRKLVLVTTYTSGDPRGTAIFEGQALLRRTLSRADYCRATFWSVYSHQDYRREDGFVEQMIARTAGNDLWQPQGAYERHVRAVTSGNTEGRLGPDRRADADPRGCRGHPDAPTLLDAPRPRDTQQPPGSHRRRRPRHDLESSERRR